jgi:CubicO group peptidase (beta-lactamase class C family)/transcriptional regulator with XRE-family HTH domain
METQSIAKNLVYQRKLKGFTQEELSEKTQVTIRTIQRIEKGDVTPHLQTVKLLATALHIEVEDLLVLDNPKEEALLKKWLLLLHGTPFLGFIIPLANILFPLFLWIHKREDNKVYNKHGIMIINFQITMSLLYIVSFVALLTIEKWGFILFVSVIPFSVIVMIINIIRAINTQKCYYPLSIPFLKFKPARSVGMIALFLTMLTFCNCTTKIPQEIERLDGSSVSANALDQHIQKLVDTANVTGFTVTIFNQDSVAYQKAFGYSNLAKKDSLKISQTFYGASLSKAVFGYIVAQLANEGIIDLDKPIQDYLDVPIPEMPFKREWRRFKNIANDYRYKKITARMCLSHTTGFPNWRWISRTGDFEPEGKIQFYFDPGTDYSYSGEGIHLLQKVIEKITGKGLEQIASERVFDPLKMDMTSYVWQQRFEGNYCNGHTTEQKVIDKDTEDEAGAAGSMETTPVDYAKFLSKIIELSAHNSAVTKLMFTPNIRIHSKKQFGPMSLEKTTVNDNIDLSYGLAWGILNTPYGHGYFKEGHGEGFQHYSIIFPKKQMGILLMTNSDNAESIFKEVLEIGIGDSYTPWYWEDYIPYNKR